jgi:hypothetical protein
MVAPQTRFQPPSKVSGCEATLLPVPTEPDWRLFKLYTEQAELMQY